MDTVEGSGVVLNAILRQGSFTLEALGISGVTCHSGAAC